jgi:hypothetical protein
MLSQKPQTLDYLVRPRNLERVVHDLLKRRPSSSPATDVYEKTAEGWRMKSRRILGTKLGTSSTAFKSPNSASASSAGATDRTRPPSTLTSSDYLELQQLIARSAYALDIASDGGTTYADLFVQTGTLSDQDRTSRGRAEIAGFVHGAPQPPAYHFVTNPTIEPTADGATGTLYVASFDIGAKGVPSHVASGARYEDAYVRTDAGWRIKSRTMVASKTGPQP